MELIEIDFIDLERKTKRAGAFYYTFQRVPADDGKTITYLYSGYEQGYPQGLADSLWNALTKGLERIYNVTVTFKHPKCDWVFVFPTSIPEAFRVELEKLYGNADTVGTVTESDVTEELSSDGTSD